mmetsp:Transcript_40549/g.95216  ORF Transcript_40549/g.95216 Transcript_40549/m.95216 type:complete len:130 (-) Transcript_40549:452-841(-)
MLNFSASYGPTLEKYLNSYFFFPSVASVTPLSSTVSFNISVPEPVLHTPPLKLDKFASFSFSRKELSWRAFSVCVSANNSVHCSFSSVSSVTSARWLGTPHPLKPPTAGRTMAAPDNNADEQADPIPNA